MIMLCAAAPIASNAMPADTFPNRPLRFVSAMAPGGTGDLNARRLADQLKAHLGQQIVVENRAGAGGNIAAQTAAAATPDGYTLLFASHPIFAVNPLLNDKMPFKLGDFATVALISKTPHVLLVNNALPVTNLGDLISYAKTRAVGLNFGSGGVGTSVHLAGELLKARTGMNLVHVPYKGAALSVTALVSNEIQLLFDASMTAVGHIRGGRAKALAIAHAHRSPVVPELPTFAEIGLPGFEAGVSHGLLAPAATPAAIVARLNHAINTVLNDATFRKQMAESGVELVGGTPKQFLDYLNAEHKLWSEVVRKLNLSKSAGG
jgi:tripartite-type tricarboxylate transporter receptor subunit TctC